jgi:hypothetical protein
MKIIGTLIFGIACTILGIALGTLLTATPHQVERVSVEFCDGGNDPWDSTFVPCYYQDVPAAQFIGKPYTIAAPGHFRTCDLDGTRCPTVMVGNRYYLLNPSEVTK